MKRKNKSTEKKINGLKHTIRGRFTLIFLLLMTGTILLSVIFSNAYIDKYYIHQKEKLFEQLYYEIHDVEVYSGLISTENNRRLYKLCEDFGIDIALGDSSLLFTVFSSGNAEEMSELLKDCIFRNESINLPSSGAYIKKLIKSNDKYDIFRTHDNRFNADYLLCFGCLDTGIYFMIKAPVQNITENAVIAGRFYAYVAAVVTVIGSIAAYFIIKKMTRPILNISNIADRMAHLDFNARYENNDNNEIGILGNSINHMSEQLEKAISDLKAVNLELQKDIEKKEQIDEMRKEFLSNVSHELKTPIALIQGYAEGLKEEINDDPESREWYCEVIMDEAAKMNNMVKKILNLNQLEFGDNQISMEHFDLSVLIDGVISHYQYLFEQKSARLSVDKPDSLMVWADEFMIEEVIRNYISNAVNHLDGEKIITIKAESVDGRAIVSIKNTGTQIPEEALDKVWIKFYKVDKARTREYGGSGIGLSIVKAIMDSHHKPFGVFNNEDGVTFWFELDASNE